MINLRAMDNEIINTQGKLIVLLKKGTPKETPIIKEYNYKIDLLLELKSKLIKDNKESKQRG